MPTRIRFRTDSAHDAEEHSRLLRGLELRWTNPGVEEDHVRLTPPAVPGDTWVVRWYKQDAENHQGPIAGYAICCPKCQEVHRWTTALNCGSKLPSGSCAHSGNGSCWTWTGNAEDGTLHAAPSLWCVADRGGCGYHGHLHNGVLTDG